MVFDNLQREKNWITKKHFYIFILYSVCFFDFVICILYNILDIQWKTKIISMNFRILSMMITIKTKINWLSMKVSRSTRNNLVHRNSFRNCCTWRPKRRRGRGSTNWRRNWRKFWGRGRNLLKWINNWNKNCKEAPTAQTQQQRSNW